MPKIGTFCHSAGASFAVERLVQLKNPGSMRERFFGIGRPATPQNDRWRERFFGVGRSVTPQNDIIIGNQVVIERVKK